MRIATPKDLGALAREARLTAGLTQTELGAQIGASRFWVAQFERGKSGAELGLALKAVRVLGLVISIEPLGTAHSGVVREPAPDAYLEHAAPSIDLSAILDGTTRSATSGPEQ